MKFRNKNKSGFTLIELLVVIAIIGLLASIVLLALNGARQKSRDATRLADVRQLASAFELFFNDAGAYPTGNAAYTPATWAPGTPGAQFGLYGLTATTQNGSFYFTPNYIGTIPNAPTPFDAGTAGCTASTNTFMYAATPAGTTYTLSFCLGAITGGYPAGVRTLSPSGIK